MSQQINENDFVKKIFEFRENNNRSGAIDFYQKENKCGIHEASLAIDKVFPLTLTLDVDNRLGNLRKMIERLNNSGKLTKEQYIKFGNQLNNIDSKRHELKQDILLKRLRSIQAGIFINAKKRYKTIKGQVHS